MRENNFFGLNFPKNFSNLDVLIVFFIRSFVFFLHIKLVDGPVAGVPVYGASVISLAFQEFFLHDRSRVVPN